MIFNKLKIAGLGGRQREAKGTLHRRRKALVSRNDIERMCREARIPREDYGFRALVTDLISNLEVKEALKLLKEEYRTVKAMAEAIGVSESTIRTRLRVYKNITNHVPIKKTWVDVLIVQKARLIDRT